MVKMIALILLLALNADARMCPGNIGGEYVVASCSTTAQSCTTTSNQTDSSVGATYRWKAGKFVATKNTTICAIELDLKKSGSPTFTYTVAIYGSTGTEPDESNIISTSSSFNTADLTTGYVLTKLTGLSASLTNAGEYWMVVTTSTTDASNYIQIRTDTGCDYEEGVLYSSNGTSWTSSDSGRSFRNVMYE